MTDTKLHLEISQDELRHKLSELIGIPSVVEDGYTEMGVVEAIVRWCRADGVSFETFQVGADSTSSWNGKGIGPVPLYCLRPTQIR